MKCMEEDCKLALPISRFVLPLGMTIHMPGATMYYAMIALFVAQMQGLSITLTMLFTLTYMGKSCCSNELNIASI